MSDWVTDLIDKLENATNGIMEMEVGGVKITAVIGQDLVKFFKDNKAMLMRVGRETFSAFLILMNEKKNEDALNLLLAKMSADNIIDRMRMNAAELHAHTQLCEDFVKKLLAFAETVLLGAASKIIIGLLIP